MQYWSLQWSDRYFMRNINYYFTSQVAMNKCIVNIVCKTAHHYSEECWEPINIGDIWHWQQKILRRFSKSFLCSVEERNSYNFWNNVKLTKLWQLSILGKLCCKFWGKNGYARHFATLFRLREVCKVHEVWMTHTYDLFWMEHNVQVAPFVR